MGSSRCQSGDILDDNTSEIDNTQESVDNFLLGLCDTAIDFLVPNELQQFSCQIGAANQIAVDWIELVTFEPTIEAEFCTDDTVTELDSGMSYLFRNLQAECT